MYKRELSSIVMDPVWSDAVISHTVNKTCTEWIFSRCSMALIKM